MGAHILIIKKKIILYSSLKIILMILVNNYKCMNSNYN